MITQFRSPDKLDEALKILADGGQDIKLLSGEMSLIPMMSLGLVRPLMVLSLNRIEGRHCLPLADATALIGDTQVRNRGTIGGSLAHADPAADYGPVLVAVGARMIVRSSRGDREIPAGKFFTNLMETALKSDEILAEIIIPKLGSARGAYTRLHRIESKAISP